MQNKVGCVINIHFSCDNVEVLDVENIFTRHVRKLSFSKTSM